MRGELEAVKAKVEALGYVVHLHVAPTVTKQYVVIEAPSTDGPIEERLADGDPNVDTTVQVRAVTGTPEGVAIMLDRIRADLTPGREWTRLDVPGRFASLRWVRPEFIAVDTTVTFVDSDRHPAVGGESYRLVSEPA